MFSAKSLQRVVLLMVILSALTSSFIVEVHAAPDPWSIVIPDIGGRVGSYTSLALDPNGYPHISYCKVESVGSWTSIDLKYARWTGSEWVTEVVDDMGGTDVGWEGMDTSLALDANGYPHISYMDHQYRNLKYARWTGSEWVIETIDSINNVGFFPSLVLDSNDYPHISYHDYTYGNLKYARWIGDQWDITTIDSVGDVGWFTSLALDSSDYPHVSYYDANNHDLKYARWSGTQWSIYLIDSGGDVGLYTSIALDSSDHPHISYHDWDISALKYASWSGSEWTLTIVDYLGYPQWLTYSEHTCLTLDSSDHPHISYMDREYKNLKYARWTGSIWIVETIDSDGEVGLYSSLALDSSDHPHISYHDETIEVLKYARAPDEYFSDITLAPFDSNGDGFNDAVEVEMDVDTTYSGTLGVYVDADLSNPVYGIVDSNSVGWSITGTAVDYHTIYLGTQPGSIAGGYDIELYLYDGDDNWEDQAFLIEPVYLYPPTTSFESCTALGVHQDSFELQEAIYVTGTDFTPSTSSAVYVVEDMTWTDGTTIPGRVTGTATSITSTSDGDIDTTEVWSSPLTLGTYDIVVDVNGNGVYDMGVDALDDSDIEVTAGVEVIPEFTVAMLVPVLAGLSLIAVVVKKRLPLN